MATNVPTRLLVLQRMCDLLGTIRYEYPGRPGEILSLEGAVFRGRNLMGEESKPWPAISIQDAVRGDPGFYAGENEIQMKDQWALLLTCVADEDELNPQDPAHYLVSEVMIALSKIMATKRSGTPAFPEWHYLGGLITNIEINPPVVRRPDDRTSSAAFAFLPVRVGFSTSFDQPYTSV